MSLRLETRNLTKLFGSFKAVESVSLSFEPGRIHAVLGENGAGKSTLMKLLFGLHQPTRGDILLNGKPVVWRSSMDAIRHGLGMVQQHFSLVDRLSAIDNIMLGDETCGRLGKLNRRQAIAHLEALLPSSQLAVPWLTTVENLTVGEKQRVEILKLLFRESKILFLDEPTAVLTPGEIDDFFNMLKLLRDGGRTVILITHKINEVLQGCDTYSVLRQGQLVARGEVSGASVDSIVESMIGRKLIEIDIERRRPGSGKLLEVEGLQEESRQRGCLNGVTMNVRPGEIVGVAGIEGSGQTHFVEALMGLRNFRGKIGIGGETLKPLQTLRVRELGTGLVPEDRLEQGLWLDESCHMNMMVGLENLFLEKHIFDFDRLKSATGQWAKGYDVRSSSLDVNVGHLSGGNQQKIIFAREVTGRKPKLLICHQPTRGVDLGAIDLIHRSLLELRNDGLGVLVLSSELDELLKLCDRIYVFFEGRVSAEFKRSEFDRLKVGAAMTGAQNVS